MPTVTTEDGAQIFYKDWGDRPAGHPQPRLAAERGRVGRPRCSWPSTATAPSPTTDAVTAGPARPGTATRWTPTPTTSPP